MINSKKKSTYKEIRKEKSVTLHKAGGKLPIIFQESFQDRMSKNMSNTGLENFLKNRQVQGTPVPRPLFPIVEFPAAWLSSLQGVRHPRQQALLLGHSNSPKQETS